MAQLNDLNPDAGAKDAPNLSAGALTLALALTQALTLILTLSLTLTLTLTLSLTLALTPTLALTRRSRAAGVGRAAIGGRALRPRCRASLRGSPPRETEGVQREWGLTRERRATAAPPVRRPPLPPTRSPPFFRCWGFGTRCERARKPCSRSHHYVRCVEPF